MSRPDSLSAVEPVQSHSTQAAATVALHLDRHRPRSRFLAATEALREAGKGHLERAKAARRKFAAAVEPVEHPPHDRPPPARMHADAVRDRQANERRNR